MLNSAPSCHLQIITLQSSDTYTFSEEEAEVEEQAAADETCPEKSREDAPPLDVTDHRHASQLRRILRIVARFDSSNSDARRSRSSRARSASSAKIAETPPIVSPLGSDPESPESLSSSSVLQCDLRGKPAPTPLIPGTASPGRHDGGSPSTHSSIHSPKRLQEPEEVVELGEVNGTAPDVSLEPRNTVAPALPRAAEATTGAPESGIIFPCAPSDEEKVDASQCLPLCLRVEDPCLMHRVVDCRLPLEERTDVRSSVRALRTTSAHRRHFRMQYPLLCFQDVVSHGRSRSCRFTRREFKPCTLDQVTRFLPDP